MEPAETSVVLRVDGVSGFVGVSVASIRRLLASHLPHDLEHLATQLESSKGHFGADPTGVIALDASERNALRHFIFKAKYERQKDMPLDLFDLEERLRSS